MTGAIAARTRGDDYQARVFWLHACRLFQEHSAVEEIAYDDPELRYFEDVSLYYRWGVPDERGGNILADHYQVKFHVDCSGCITWDSLIDPSFLGAKNHSLLQRIQEFQSRYASVKIPFRLYFVSPWGTDSADPLAKLISNQGGELRLGVLFDGGSDRTAMGRIRKSWREHLKVDDEGLRKALEPLRILPRYFDLKVLSELVNVRLGGAGLTPVGDHNQANVYDDLIRKIHQAGRVRFTREQLWEICEQERLCDGTQSQGLLRDEVYGIRSFMRWAEHMEDETKSMLCLVRHFDNRRISDPTLWASKVLPEIKTFVGGLKPGGSYSLLLDAHISICLAAGYFLPMKSGVEVSVVQGTQGRRVLWRPGQIASPTEANTWSVRQEPVNSSASEVAVGVSVTHDVAADVRAYVTANLSKVGRTLVFSVLPAVGPAAIRDADHALALAQELVSTLRKERSLEERTQPVHLFISAPAGFSFFVGRLAQSLGALVVYEYDFETNAPGAYEPGIRLPISES
jgi:SMODS-associated and fused to various effectors sensor domain